jgi:hypothetical protein
MNNQPEPSSQTGREHEDHTRSHRRRHSNRLESLRQYAFFRVLDEWDEESGPPRTWRFGFYIDIDSVEDPQQKSSMASN